MAIHKFPISDTISVTPDGRTDVDMRKLLAKKHIQDMMREMRSKIRVVTRDSRGADPKLHPPG